MAVQRQHGRARLVMVMVAVIFASLIGFVSPAQAVVNQADTTIKGGNTFYAFVKKGERLRVIWGGTQKATVLGENGTNVNIGSNGYTGVAGTDGVWRITLKRESGTSHGFDYDLSVRDGTTERKGRIWVNEDLIYQRAKFSGFETLNYFGVSDEGYVYKITMNEMNGIDSKIALRSTGAAPDAKCNVESRSFESSSHLDCGDKYRLFFEDPRNSGLPQTAKMGNSTVPVLPNLVSSAQLKGATKVTFTPNYDKVGGAFVVSSHAGFSGTAELQIDANGNGSYTDSVDVVQTVVVNKGKSEPWTWNGKNKAGADVRNGGSARAVIDKSGEAHLLLIDVETFGGLTMTRLNGESPNSTIRWDDRKLTEKRGGSKPSTSCVNGCNSNVSGGLHGWSRGDALPGDTESSSWGDGRIIDNWAYASVNATSPAIALPALRTLTFDATGGSITGATSINRTNGQTWGTLPTATAANKDFAGWFTAKTGGTQVTAKTVAGGNITAYAQWVPTARTLTFDATGGSITGVPSITKPHGSAWGTLPTATSSNKDFVGWFTAKTGGTQVTAATVANGNITAYAQWKPTPRTLTFDATGGKISGASSIVQPHGSPWGTLPTATQAGKVFLGWYTAQTGGTQVTAATVATGNITAYAQWRPAKFNVVFDGNAQTGKIAGSMGSVTFDSGCTSCTLPANAFTKTTGAPELIDHEGETAEVNSTFLGWSLDPLSRTGSIADRAAAGNLSQTDGATVRLYAIWDDAPRFIVTDYPDRFFTLGQAKDGVVTETELLRTVKASDRETNPLTPKTREQVQSSGSDVGVTLFDYDATDYTSLTASAVVTATYKVKDEAGHVAFLRIRVHVSDEAPLAQNPVQYLRGISAQYADKEPGAGGLSQESLWKTDPTRQAALAKALDGSSATTYCLDVDAIAELRGQVGNGLGNSENPDGLAASRDVLREKGGC